MELLHGHRLDFVASIGLCLTDSLRAAKRYGTQVTEVEIDLDALVVVEVAGYDRETDTAPGDVGTLCDMPDDVDVIVYDDEDPYGEPHTTWRLVSQRAVDALRAGAA